MKKITILTIGLWLIFPDLEVKAISFGFIDAIQDQMKKLDQKIKEANNPPNPPTNPSPPDGATRVGTIGVTLSWECSDPDGNPLTYDVYLGTGNSYKKMSTQQTETSFTITEALDEGTTYGWYIVVWDDHNNRTFGKAWYFRTDVSINWTEIRANDVAVLSGEWGPPKMVEVSTDEWEDGAYISGDGKTLYFAYYPGDLLNDVQTGNFKDDIDVYYSLTPFSSKAKHSISEDIWSEGGVMISGSDMYYMSNKPINNNDKIYDSNIYKNGELLSFNTDQEEGDPHYCSAKDELYFWMNKEIYVYKNNQLSKLPKPINDGNENIQPFLTPDGQTMYFSSNRDGGVLKIHKSKRLGEDSWSNPEIIVSSKNGVGEPTLTEDGKFLFFVQVFRSQDGRYNSDIFYSERK